MPLCEHVDASTRLVSAYWHDEGAGLKGQNRVRARCRRQEAVRDVAPALLRWPMVA